MSMTPLQAIAATKFLEGDGLSPHIMQAFVAEYESTVSPIRSAVFSFISLLPEEEQEAAYAPLLTAWPAGIGWTTPAGLKDWATELYTPVDCEKPAPEETDPVNEGIIADSGEFDESEKSIPVGYDEEYTPEEVIANVTVDPDTGVGTADVGTINTEYGKVTGKFDEALTTMDKNFGITGTNFDLTQYNMMRAFSGYKMHDKAYQDTLLYKGLPFAQAVLDYCNYVLCAGDIGRFSMVVDKVSSYVSTTGEVLDVIEKAKTMKFSDFGPKVENYSDVINMGMNKVAEEMASFMPKLPTPPSLPSTPAKALGTALSAQGNVAGDPKSENAGTAIGMWESLLKAGRKDLLEEIVKSYINNVGFTFNVYIPVNGTVVADPDYLLQLTLPATESTVTATIAEAEARANKFTESADSSTQLKGFYIKGWVERRRASGIESTITSWATVGVTIIVAAAFGTGSSELTRALVSANNEVYREMFLVESKMETAINGLDKDTMQRITDALGAKVDVTKLSSNTGVLDIKEVAKAVPAPMTAETIPKAIKSVLGESINSVLPGGITIPKPIILGQNVGGVVDKLVKSTETLSQIGEKALKIADNLSIGGIGGIVAGLKSSAKSLKDSLGQIKGFEGIGEMKKLGGLFKSVETVLPVPPNAANPTEVQITPEDIAEARRLSPNEVAQGLPEDQWNVSPAQVARNRSLNKSLTNTLKPVALNAIKEVMPPGIEAQFKSLTKASFGGLPIPGTGSGGRYKVTDFLGSPVAMNGQIELWKKLNESVSNTGVVLPGKGATLEQLVAALEEAAATETGKAATEAYNKIIEQFNKEWALLKKAKVDFVNLPCGDIVAAINLSKKLAQYAQKLENGVAELFNSAANPDTLGGQALLSIMVEARNLKTMQTAGLNPANVIESKGDKVEPTEQDREEAARIQAESGDPEATTPEQVARNRAINKSLTNAILPRLGLPGT